MQLSVFEKQKQEFINICKDYNGTIEQGEDFVLFSNINEICNYYIDGTICQKKKVYCELRIQNQQSFIGLDGYERTYAILGGFGGRYSKDTLLYNLKKYNFEKCNQQLSIFDYEGIL